MTKEEALAKIKELKKFICERDENVGSDDDEIFHLSEEAIEYLQIEVENNCRKCKYIKIIGANKICDYCKDQTLNKFVSEAVRKQIPKKMYRDKVYKCSSCNNKIIKANDGCIDYCCCCGQRIDWSEDE